MNDSRRNLAVSAYLGLNALAFIGGAAWCLAQPDSTAKSIGFRLEGASGHSEYQTVYGGLQAGLGAFFALGAFVPKYRDAALAAAAMTYAGIAVGRGAAYARYDIPSNMTNTFAALEFTMAAAGGALLGLGRREKP